MKKRRNIDEINKTILKKIYLGWSSTQNTVRDKVLGKVAQ
jgi:hypothetical protein